LSNSKTVIHPNAYAFKTPASPHYAAVVMVLLLICKIVEPQKSSCGQGAGGVFVPIDFRLCDRFDSA
jgi:dethiobiotin synthetase